MIRFNLVAIASVTQKDNFDSRVHFLIRGLDGVSKKDSKVIAYHYLDNKILYEKGQNLSRFINNIIVLYF